MWWLESKLSWAGASKHLFIILPAQGSQVRVGKVWEPFRAKSEGGG
jgi:hypothetical protein